MKKYFLLTLAVMGGVLGAGGQTLRTNELMIGDEVVKSQVVGGKIVGDKWMAVSNELIRVHTEVSPIAGPTNASKGLSSTKSHSKPSLRLLLSTASSSSNLGAVKGLHGLMYMAEDFKTPALTRTEKVDILSSKDNSRIVIMVADNGPIYSSTNSGMTWTVISTPGDYSFPVDGGFTAAATIHPSAENQKIAGSPTKSWYAIASGPDSSGLILTQDVSHATPALSITRSSDGVVLSWPSAFSGYVLQASEDFGNWVDVSNAVNVVGERNQVLVTSPVGKGFYRLRSQ